MEPHSFLASLVYLLLSEGSLQIGLNSAVSLINRSRIGDEGISLIEINH